MKIKITGIDEEVIPISEVVNMKWYAATGNFTNGIKNKIIFMIIPDNVFSPNYPILVVTNDGKVAHSNVEYIKRHYWILEDVDDKITLTINNIWRNEK